MTILSRRDESFLCLASKVAEMSNERNRHGAVIVRGGSVLSLGFNVNKNSPNQLTRMNSKNVRKECGIHAEAAAIRRSPGSKRATIYISRIGKAGQTLLSRPCKDCERLILQAGIKKIIYTT